MAINIYDKASIVKKNNTYYYFLKTGSKNCFDSPYQTIVDNNFHNKFISRQSRESDWNIIAMGDENAVKNDAIATTKWNAPTSWYYGQVRFGNKKNIALYFVKIKNKIIDYNLLTEIQKRNIDNNIEYYINELKMKFTIDLNNIPIESKVKNEIKYCSDIPFLLQDYKLQYNGLDYWNCDNL